MFFHEILEVKQFLTLEKVRPVGGCGCVEAKKT